ncbi:Acetyltransferase (GNAT) family protein [Thiorhodovibrio winogradskyi]|uniref:Acetyltransferase (GNAT) family protein n=1 Tax=Thiorhodovibrio winogradskyi TaxID=77007 RepID=A0ABZ0SH97_9GAMM|nr:GNAT family N-acetyltransferase [Thiorhodovibrio winogradskyi]
MPTATLPEYRIEYADWQRQGRELRAVRQAVFIEELSGEETREWDRADTKARHLLVRAGEPPEAIGTLRWLPSGQIERLAVKPAWRGRGIGSALLASAARELQSHRRVTPFVYANDSTQAFFARLGLIAEDAPVEQQGQRLQRMVLQAPEALISADLRARLLGETSGRLFLTQRAHLALAVRQLAAQARRQVNLLSTDLQPDIYDHQDFVEALRYLAIELRGRLPVKILVSDPEPSLRRGHRLIELARLLSSDVQIRLVPKDWAEYRDQFLLCDQDGLCLTRHQDPRRTLVDFNSGAETRRLRRLFDQIWEQGDMHPGLRRLYL